MIVHLPCLNNCDFKSTDSVPWLSDVISESIFYIAGFVKALLYQGLDSLLKCWSFYRGNARIPPSSDFNIRRQAVSIDQSLDINDCPFVEGCDPRRKSINKLVEFSIR